MSASAFEIECLSHGLRAYDGQRSLLPGVSMPCSVTLADRDGRALMGRRVELISEAGRFIATEPSGPDGVIAVEHQAALPLPLDVEPVQFTAPVSDGTHTGVPLAPEWMHPEEWREDPASELTATQREPRRPDPIRLNPDGTRPTNNPRDNLVSVIAVVDGEEAFTDTNGNGTFDANEPFVDLTEPFVDSNDDGTWGNGELFIDADANGRWDGANGKWDATTKIWVATRVLWTGLPVIEDVRIVATGVANHRVVVTLPMQSLEFVCAADPCDRAMATTAPVGSTFMADPWFNALTHAAGDRCDVLDPSGPVSLTGEWMSAARAQTDWPAGKNYAFTVIDARQAPSPLRRFGVRFSVGARCRFSNPTDGHWGEFILPVAQGTIE